MAATFLEHFVVRHREADRRGDLRLAGWFDFLQEAAANHASQLGVGLEMLQKDHRIWVLSRLKLEMRRPLRIGEHLAVETWPNGFRKLHAARQFRITAGDGSEIGRASSRWLLLDLPRRRPLKPALLPVELPDNSTLPDYFALEEKLSPRELVPELEIPIRYSMEDVNGHLNNAEYAGIVQDFAASKLGESPHFRTVEIHFLAAVRSPDVLSVGGEFDANTLFVEGRNRNGEASFTALATF